MTPRGRLTREIASAFADLGVDVIDRPERYWPHVMRVWPHPHSLADGILADHAEIADAIEAGDDILQNANIATGGAGSVFFHAANAGDASGGVSITFYERQ